MATRKQEFKYTGVADERSFTKEDFERHGVDDQDAVTFNAENGFTQSLSKKAAEFLADQGESFTLASEADAAEEEAPVT
jgi:hypothetical protein